MSFAEPNIKWNTPKHEMNQENEYWGTCKVQNVFPFLMTGLFGHFGHNWYFGLWTEWKMPSVFSEYFTMSVQGIKLCDIRLYNL